MEFKKRLVSLEKIISMGERLLTTFDVAELLDALVCSVTELLTAEGATLYLVDPVENKLISQSIQSSGIREILLPMDDSSIAGHTAVARRSLNIVDAYADLSVFHPDLKFNRHVDEQTGHRTRNIITHPLLINNDLIGVFQVINKAGGPFDEDDQAMLSNFSLVAAIAIMNARLMEKVMETQTSYYNVIENISDLVIVQNREGLILQINRTSADYLQKHGRNPEVCGEAFVDAFPELSNFNGEIRKVIEGNLNKSVYYGNPSFVILSEKNFQQRTDKVILIVKNLSIDSGIGAATLRQ